MLPNTESKSKTTNPIERVFTLIKDFESAQQKYRKYGAQDTEPDGIFQTLLDRAVKGKTPVVPCTGNQWDLYASSMDCSEAAHALHECATNVITAIEEVPVRLYDELHTRIKNYCWRVY